MTIDQAKLSSSLTDGTFSSILAMSLLANPIPSINKTGVISPRYNVRITDFEKWVVKLLPSRQFGYIVLTTSSGIMDHEEARRKHVAGKILGYVVFPPMHWSDTDVVLPVSSTRLFALRIGDRFRDMHGLSSQSPEIEAAR